MHSHRTAEVQCNNINILWAECCANKPYLMNCIVQAVVDYVPPHRIEKLMQKFPLVTRENVIPTACDLASSTGMIISISLAQSGPIACF